MYMYGMPVGSEYVEHLTDKDLEVLAAAAGVPARPAELRVAPGQVPRLFDRPEVFHALFGPSAERMIGVSPFMVFATVVHRAAAELASASHVVERSGARDRIPVFDGPQLADFLDSEARRLFLAELLASFARVASGRYWVQTSRGWRVRRFSELDPVRLAGVLDSLPVEERPGAYRRLGDVALFLVGVFPDYARRNSLGPLDAARLLRAAGSRREAAGDMVDAPAIELFEFLGVRWYRQACELAPARSARLAVVDEVAARFRHARRALNFMADRYLFPAGNPWFA
jgi:hypothetical protein